MITYVHDNANSISYQVKRISMVDDTFMCDCTSYVLDLESTDGEKTLFNVPMCVEVTPDRVYKYHMADITTALEGGKSTYDYEKESFTRLYECGSFGEHSLTCYGATYTEPHTSVSIYQHGKEPLTQEATTIPDLIEILEYAKTLDFTEIVISGVFTKGIKRSK